MSEVGGRGGGPKLRTMSEVYQFSLKSVAPKVVYFYNLIKNCSLLLVTVFVCRLLWMRRLAVWWWLEEVLLDTLL